MVVHLFLVSVFCVNSISDIKPGVRNVIRYNYKAWISSELSKDEIRQKILSCYSTSSPLDFECVDAERLTFRPAKLGFPAHHTFPQQYQLCIQECETGSNILVEVCLAKPTTTLIALFSLLCVVFQVALLASAPVFSIVLLIPLFVVLFLNLMIFISLRWFSKDFINMLHDALCK